MKEYNMLQNSLYIVKEMFRKYPSSKWKLPSKIIVDVIKPAIAIATPSIVIACIMEGSLKKYLWVLAGLFLVQFLVNTFSLYLDSYMEHMGIYTRCGSGGLMYQLMCKVIRIDYLNVEPHEKQKLLGKAVNALSTNWSGPEEVLRESIHLVTQILGVITYAAAIITLDYRIILIMFVMMIMNYILVTYACQYSDKVRPKESELGRKWWYLSSHIGAEYGKDIRIYRMQGWLQAIAKNIFRSIMKIATVRQVRWYFPTISDETCIFIRNYIAYGILISAVLGNEMSVAAFTMYIGLIGGVSDWFTCLALSVSNVKRSSHEMNDYRHYMEEKNMFSHEGGEEIPLRKDGMEIEFRDVSFRYDDEGEEILSHMSFTIHPGDKLALVGNNGAGKTTLVKLLCGLYRPTSGAIYVNGVDVAKTNIETYQSLIGVLFQDLNVMPYTVATNVSGCVTGQVDRERVISCLKQAGIWEKVDRLADKEDTFLTRYLVESGVELSGGEKQKLLLARALYKGGELLILDEPTAALDPLAESQMYEQYNEMTANKSALFISHRLASTKFCNRIFFLENGQIAEEGTHEELMQRGGKYAEIFAIQSHYYQEGEEPA